MCIYIYICFVAYIEKQKKKRIFKVVSPSARAAALGEEGVFRECLGSGAWGRGCLPRVPGLRRSEKRVSSPSIALGEDFFFFLNKEMVPAATNGVNSSPSTRMALEKAFPEYTIFGSRGRRLSREEIPRALFPECCTRERLPRVQLSLPRVHLALGEATASRSGNSSRCEAGQLLRPIRLTTTINWRT